ncbi:MAG: hypothetical protein ACFB0D_17915 [Phormidesmis sp.]
MDEWLKQLQANLHEAAKDSSDWFAEVSKQSNEAIDAAVEASVSTLESVDKAIAPALDQFGDQLVNQMDSAVDASVIFIEQQLTPWIEQTSAPLTNTAMPWLQNHTACIGCRHYHGTAYGEEMLVCGMHPYGPEARTCNDWASVWPSDASS